LSVDRDRLGRLLGGEAAARLREPNAATPMEAEATNDADAPTGESLS